MWSTTSRAKAVTIRATVFSVWSPQSITWTKSSHSLTWNLVSTTNNWGWMRSAKVLLLLWGGRRKWGGAVVLSCISTGPFTYSWVGRIERERGLGSSATDSWVSYWRLTVFLNGCFFICSLPSTPFLGNINVCVCFLIFTNLYEEPVSRALTLSRQRSCL